MWPAKWPFVRTAHFGFTLGRLNYYRELGRFSWKRRYVMGGIMGRVKFRMKTNLEHLRYIWLYNCYIFWMSSVEFNNWYCYTKSKISKTVTLSCRAVSELIVIRYNTIVHKCTCNWSVWLFNQPFIQPNQGYLSSCHLWLCLWFQTYQVYVKLYVNLHTTDL